MEHKWSFSLVTFLKDKVNMIIVYVWLVAS